MSSKPQTPGSTKDPSLETESAGNYIVRFGNPPTSPQDMNPVFVRKKKIYSIMANCVTLSKSSWKCRVSRKHGISGDGLGETAGISWCGRTARKLSPQALVRAAA